MSKDIITIYSAYEPYFKDATRSINFNLLKIIFQDQFEVNIDNLIEEIQTKNLKKKTFSKSNLNTYHYNEYAYYSPFLLVEKDNKKYIYYNYALISDIEKQFGKNWHNQEVYNYIKNQFLEVQKLSEITIL